MGVEFKGIASAPVGYLTVLRMYPRDFEEFMIANNVSRTTLDMLEEKFRNARCYIKSTFRNTNWRIESLN